MTKEHLAGWGIAALILFTLLYMVFLNIPLAAFFSPASYDEVELVMGYLHGGPLPEMSEREQLHMHDVRELFGIFARFLGIIGIIGTTFVLTANPRRSLRTASNILTATAIVILVFLLTFPWAFIVFHKILFRNDYWLLPNDSLLITLFPTRFFVLMAIAALLYIVTCSAGLRWISRSKKTGEKRASISKAASARSSKS